MRLPRRVVTTTCSLIAVAMSRTRAQSSNEGKARISERDSLAYIRDSTAIDSLSHFVPVDSLRQLYRRLPRENDPVSTMRALRCEAYRLWYAYGRPAEMAEDRIAAAEWTPDLRDAVHKATEIVRRELFLPSRSTCGLDDQMPRAPLRLRYAPQAPWRPQFVRPGSSLDVIRGGATVFEGTMTAHINGRDTTITLAGSADIRRGEDFAELRMVDKLRAQQIIGLYIWIAGAPFLYPGSYPILGSDDVRGAPNVGAVYTQGAVPPNWVGERWGGTLVVERADSVGAEGRFAFWTQRNGLSFLRARMPVDSLRDTIYFEGKFRSRYNRDDERLARDITRFPSFPRRFAPPRPPDAGETLSRMFLDENVPCDQLPIYAPSTVLTPLSSGTRSAPHRAALSILVDSTGAPWLGGIRVLSTDDTATIRAFQRQQGLRFRRTETNQFLDTVRCTLTLPAASR
jgi:hypothetical protein